MTGNFSEKAYSQEMSLLMQLLLLYVLIDGLFCVFHGITVTAEAGKPTCAVANESDTGRNILLSIHYLRRVMVPEQIITASH
jgi:hypothetical protein